MPTTRSAKKAHRQSLQRKMRNNAHIHAYKKIIKVLLRLNNTAPRKDMQTVLSLLYKQLDKAAKTHALSRNKARRLKSRFAKRFLPTSV
ncbi:MAG: hypothetical protein G01um101466_103 [Parcubacteria group bacterium Gr01-1014_66]|nr:MAG: hypothetical protein G01um101466_103 [Parcubacteria group bacterium Gr01-1014_66]